VNELAAQALELTFDDIANVPVADASSVSDWNTFFDLPTNGTPFTSVQVVDNVVKLYGGDLLNLIINNDSIVNISGLNNYENLSTIDMNYCTSIVTPPDISQITSLLGISFEVCSSMTSIPDISNLLLLQLIDFTACDSLEVSDLDELMGYLSVNYPDQFAI